MVDRASAGLLGEPFELDVERGKVREFARAVLAEDACFFEGDHPVVPPTFLAVAFHWEREVPGANPWEEVRMSFERGLHAEQEYVFHGPPPAAGTRLYARSRIDRIYEKQSRSAGTLTFAEMVTEYRDADGKLVAEAKLVGVETEETP
jgi:hypothetical protein